jgi:hypothetical protein
LTDQLDLGLAVYLVVPFREVAGLLLRTEKVFGFLLAALAVQLVLNGLDDVGVIRLRGH